MTLAKIGIYAIVIFIGISVGFYFGRSEAESRILKIQQEIQQETIKQLNEKDLIVEKQLKINDELSEKHEKNVSDIRSYYSNLMRNRASKTSYNCSVPSVTKAPTAIDEVSTDALPLAEQCSETTQQLVNLQSWVILQTKDN